MPLTTPTASRRTLGVRLRKLRNDAGLTLDDVAERLLLSPAKISRLETGDRMPQLRDVRELGGFYGAPTVVRDELMELARQARQPGWWQDYRLPPQEDHYVGLEASALVIDTWEPQLIPGLLQTPEYTDAVLGAFPSELGDRSRGVIAQVKVERRKRLLVDGGPQIRVILAEAVLALPMFPADLMRRQFQHLLELSERTQVTLRVLRAAAGAHVGIHGAFVVLEFEPDATDGVVHLEGLAQQEFLEKPDDLRLYRRAFELLGAVADDPDQTRDLLRRLIQPT